MSKLGKSILSGTLTGFTSGLWTPGGNSAYDVDCDFCTKKMYGEWGEYFYCNDCDVRIYPCSYCFPGHREGKNETAPYRLLIKYIRFPEDRGGKESAEKCKELYERRGVHTIIEKKDHYILSSDNPLHFSSRSYVFGGQMKFLNCERCGKYTTYDYDEIKKRASNKVLQASFEVQSRRH